MIRAAALIAVVLASPGGASADRDTEAHTIVMRASVQDHFLSPPARPNVHFQVDARAAAPKTRIMFLAPLPAGAHELRLDVKGGAGRTFVVATPLRRGHSCITVTVAGSGRFDFGFWAGEPGAPSREYRFTLQGPAAATTYEVDL